MFPAFEGLHNNIKFVIIGCTQRKLFKGNDQQGEHEQSISSSQCNKVQQNMGLLIAFNSRHIKLFCVT